MKGVRKGWSQGQGMRGQGEETLQTIRVTSKAALGLTRVLCLAFLAELDDSSHWPGSSLSALLAYSAPRDPGEGP